MGKKIQITESQLQYIVKNINRLDEQTTTTEDYGKYSFGGAFVNNYITPNTSSDVYQNTLKKMQADLQKALGEGKKLSDLKIIIHSSASSLAASNGYMGSTPPNHNFQTVGKKDGGLLPGSAWVKISAPGKKTPGYKNLTDIVAGNTFLAQNRGFGMRDALVRDLNTMGIKVTTDIIQTLGREDGSWVASSEDAKEQYVNVVIDGLFSKPPPPHNPSPYQIIYDWYSIDGSNTPYVLIDGKVNRGNPYSKYLMASYWGRGKTAIPDFFKKAVASSGDDVKVAAHACHYGDSDKTKGSDCKFYSFGTFDGFVSRKGSTFYYDDESSWMKDVKKINSMNPAETMKGVRQGGTQSTEIVKGIKARGFWEPKKNGSIDFHHGGGTNIPGGVVVLMKPTSSDGKKVTLKQVSQGVPKKASTKGKASL